MLKTKSVHSAIEPRKDGLRILATRVRGRGLLCSRYDVWMANLGPSGTLLKSAQEGVISWAEFRRSFRKELFEVGSIEPRNRNIKNHGQKCMLGLLQPLPERGTDTLLCHCAENGLRCHRHL